MYTQPYLAQNDRGYWEIRWRSPAAAAAAKRAAETLVRARLIGLIPDSIFLGSGSKAGTPWWNCLPPPR